MEIPSKYRWASGLFGGLLLLLAVAGLLDGIRAWQGYARTIQLVVPVWAMATLGIVLIAVSLAPMLWERRRVHGHKLTRAALADALEVERIGLQAEIADLKEKRAEDQKVIENLRDMVDHARLERDEAQLGLERVNKMAWQFQSILEYGAEFPNYGQLTPKDVEALVLKVWDLFRPWDAAVAAARGMWRVIGQDAKADEASIGARLWMRMDDQEHGRTERALNRLKESLEQGWDPRPYLTRLYTCYMDWRAVMLPLAHRLSDQVPLDDAYKRVQHVERRLWEEMEAKLELPLLRVVKLSMRDYDQAHGPVDPLSWAPG